MEHNNLDGVYHKGKIEKAPIGFCFFSCKFDIVDLKKHKHFLNYEIRYFLF
jgi:hypothetical protein